MRILIVRTSALGDIVHCLPVLRALRRALPEARLGWVVEETFAPLLHGHPDLDTVIPVRLRPWRRRLLSRRAQREMATAWRALRRFAPDVALDLMGNHKAGALAWLSGARRRLGAARRERREPSSALWINEAVPVRSVHAVDRALDVLAPLGVATAPVDFSGEVLLRPESPGSPGADPIPELPGGGERPLVLIQAGAGWGNKTWPASFWGEVARRLSDAAGAEVWVPIAPGEAHLAEGVAAASQGTARTIDAASFFVLAALLRRSRLVLGGDTGPIHLAHALGVPVVCVMGPTDPRRHGPWGATGDVVVRRLPCSFCYKRFAEPKACLLGLSPAEVTERGLEILARKAGPEL